MTTQSKGWTAEPWEVADEDSVNTVRIQSDKGASGLPCMPAIAFGRDRLHAQLNAARIVECVNELAGRDPAETVRAANRAETAEKLAIERGRDYQRLADAAGRLLAAAKQAIEFQQAVEDFRPHPEGSPRNTIIWMEDLTSAIRAAEQAGVE